MHNIHCARGCVARTTSASICSGVRVSAPVTTAAGTRRACRRCTDAQSASNLCNCARLESWPALSTSGGLTATFGSTNQATTRRTPVAARATSAAAGNNHSIGEQVSTASNICCAAAAASDTVTRSSAAVPTPDRGSVNCRWLPTNVERKSLSRCHGQRGRHLTAGIPRSICRVR